jgi:hypothetical protein
MSRLSLFDRDRANRSTNSSPRSSAERRSRLRYISWKTGPIAVRSRPSVMADSFRYGRPLQDHGDKSLVVEQWLDIEVLGSAAHSPHDLLDEVGWHVNLCLGQAPEQFVPDRLLRRAVLP